MPHPTECIQGGPKDWHSLFSHALTLSNIDQFFKLFSLSESGENFCNTRPITKDPTAGTAPQLCR